MANEFELDFSLPNIPQDTAVSNEIFSSTDLLNDPSIRDTKLDNLLKAKQLKEANFNLGDLPRGKPYTYEPETFTRMPTAEELMGVASEVTPPQTLKNTAARFVETTGNIIGGALQAPRDYINTYLMNEGAKLPPNSEIQSVEELASGNIAALAPTLFNGLHLLGSEIKGKVSGISDKSTSKLIQQDLSEIYENNPEFVGRVTEYLGYGLNNPLKIGEELIASLPHMLGLAAKGVPTAITLVSAINDNLKTNVEGFIRNTGEEPVGDDLTKLVGASTASALTDLIASRFTLGGGKLSATGLGKTLDELGTKLASTTKGKLLAKTGAGLSVPISGLVGEGSQGAFQALTEEFAQTKGSSVDALKHALTSPESLKNIELGGVTEALVGSFAATGADVVHKGISATKTGISKGKDKLEDIKDSSKTAEPLLGDTITAITEDIENTPVEDRAKFKETDPEKHLVNIFNSKIKSAKTLEEFESASDDFFAYSKSLPEEKREELAELRNEIKTYAIDKLEILEESAAQKDVDTIVKAEPTKRGSDDIQAAKERIFADALASKYDLTTAQLNSLIKSKILSKDDKDFLKEQLQFKKTANEVSKDIILGSKGSKDTYHKGYRQFNSNLETAYRTGDIETATNELQDLRSLYSRIDNKRNALSNMVSNIEKYLNKKGKFPKTEGWENSTRTFTDKGKTIEVPTYENESLGIFVYLDKKRLGINKHFLKALNRDEEFLASRLGKHRIKFHKVFNKKANIGLKSKRDLHAFFNIQKNPHQIKKLFQSLLKELPDSAEKNKTKAIINAVDKQIQDPKSFTESQLKNIQENIQDTYINTLKLTNEKFESERDRARAEALKEEQEVERVQTASSKPVPIDFEKDDVNIKSSIELSDLAVKPVKAKPHKFLRPDLKKASSTTTTNFNINGKKLDNYDFALLSSSINRLLTDIRSEALPLVNEIFGDKLISKEEFNYQEELTKAQEKLNLKLDPIKEFFNVLDSWKDISEKALAYEANQDVINPLLKEEYQEIYNEDIELSSLDPNIKTMLLLNISLDFAQKYNAVVYTNALRNKSIKPLEVKEANPLSDKLVNPSSMINIDEAPANGRFIKSSIKNLGIIATIPDFFIAKNSQEFKTKVRSLIRLGKLKEYTEEQIEGINQIRVFVGKFIENMDYTPETKEGKFKEFITSPLYGLLQLNKDITKGKDLPIELKQIIAVQALQTLISDGRDTLFNSQDSVSILLGKNTGAFVTPAEMNTFFDKGVLTKSIVKKLSSNISKAIGIKVNPEYSSDNPYIQKNFETDLGILALNTLSNMGYMQTELITPAYLKENVPGSFETPRPLRFNHLPRKSNDPNNEDFFQPVDELNDILEIFTSDMQKDLAKDLFNVEGSPTINFKPKVPPKKLKGSDSVNTPTMEKSLNNLTNTKVFINKNFKTLFDNIGLDLFKELSGHEIPDLEKTQKNRLRQVEGLDRFLNNNWEDLQTFYDLYFEKDKDNNKPFYFNWTGWGNNRIGIIRDIIDIQNVKYHRYGTYLEGTDSVIPAHNTKKGKKIRDQYFSAIAAAFDIEYDKKGIGWDASVQKGKDILEQAKPLISALKSKNPNQAKIQKLLKEFFIENGYEMTPHSMQGLASLMDFKKGSFKTVLYQETDSTTSGAAIATMQFITGKYSEETVRMLAAIGVYTTPDITKEDWQKTPTNVDNYESIAVNTANNIDKELPTAGNHTPIYESFNKLFKGLTEKLTSENEDTGEVIVSDINIPTKAGRKWAKLTGTPANYGAGDESIINGNVFGGIIYPIYKMLEEGKLEEASEYINLFTNYIPATKEAKDAARNLSEKTGQRVIIRGKPKNKKDWDLVEITPENALDFTFTRKQITTITEAFYDTYGFALLNAVDETYSTVAEGRSAIVGTVEAISKMYIHVRSHYIKEFTKIFERDPTNEELKVLDSYLSEYAPIFPFATSEDDVGQSDYVNLLNTEDRTVPKYKTEVVQSKKIPVTRHDFKKGENIQEDIHHVRVSLYPTRLDVSSPGASAMTQLIQGLDGSILQKDISTGEQSFLPLHDAKQNSVIDVEGNTRSFNFNWFDTYQGYSIPELVLQRFGDVVTLFNKNFGDASKFINDEGIHKKFEIKRMNKSIDYLQSNIKQIKETKKKLGESFLSIQNTYYPDTEYNINNGKPGFTKDIPIKPTEEAITSAINETKPSKTGLLSLDQIESLKSKKGRATTKQGKIPLIKYVPNITQNLRNGQRIIQYFTKSIITNRANIKNGKVALNKDAIGNIEETKSNYDLLTNRGKELLNALALVHLQIAAVPRYLNLLYLAKKDLNKNQLDELKSLEKVLPKSYVERVSSIIKDKDFQKDLTLSSELKEISKDVEIDNLINIYHKFSGRKEQFIYDKFNLNSERSKLFEEESSTETDIPIIEFPSKDTFGSDIFPEDLELEDTISETTETKETILNTFDSLENQGNVTESLEQKSKLRNIIESLVLPYLDPEASFDLTLTNANKTYGEVVGHKIDIAVANPTNPILNKLQKSAQEVFAHELSHTVTEEGLKDPLLRKTAEDLREYVKRNLSKEQFLKSIPNATTADKLEASAMYDYIFDSTAGIYEFIALGNTNEAFRNALGKIEYKPKKEKVTSVGEFIGSLFERIVAFISNKMYIGNVSTTEDAVLKLSLKIAQVNNKHKRKAKSMYSRFDSLNTPLAKAIDAIIFSPIRDFAKKDLPENFGIIRGSAYLLANIPELSKTKTFQSNLNKLRVKSHGLKSTLVQGFINAVTKLPEEIGLTPAMRKVEDLILESKNKVDRERFVTESMVHKELVESFHTKLSPEQETYLYRALKADISSLLDAYDMQDINKMLSDSSYLNNEIKNRNATLYSNYGNNSVIYAEQAEALGHFMVTNEVILPNLMSNPYLIAQGKYSDKFVSLGNLSSAETEINILKSLHAINSMNSKDKAGLSSLISEEFEVDSTENGINTLMSMHSYHKAESLEKLFDNNPAAVQSGWTSEIYDPNVQIEMSNDPNDADLLKKGFTLVGKVPADRLDPFKKMDNEYLYANNHHGLVSYVKTAMSLTDRHTMGTTLEDMASRKFGSNPLASAKKITDSMFKKNSYSLRKNVGSNINYSKNYMLPVVNPNGDIVSYRYVMKEQTREDILRKDTRVSVVLGRMYASTTDKLASKEINDKLVDFLGEDYQDNYSTDHAEFEEISPNAPRQENRELFALLPYDIKKGLIQKSGKDSSEKIKYPRIYVRSNYRDGIFGFRKFSLSQTKLLNNKFFTYAEEILQSLVKYVKHNIVVKTSVLYFNIMSNTISGMTLFGVPIERMLSGQAKASVALDEFLGTEKQIKLMELRLAYDKNLTASAKNAIQRKIDQLIFKNKDNPVKDLIDKNLFTSIVEDIDFLLEEDKYSLGGKFHTWVEEHSTKVPESVKAVYGYAYLTKDNPVYKGLLKVTQYSDFVARFTIYDHLTKGQKTSPKQREEIINNIKDTFIIYENPTSKQLLYLDNLGILPFLKYAIRIQKIAWKLIIDKPLNTISLLTGQHLLFETQDILDSLKLTPGFSNPVELIGNGLGLFGLRGIGLDPTT